MVERAFGRCGVDGPFKTSLCNFLAALQKHRELLGLVLQFAVCDGAYEPAVLPDALLAKYGKDLINKGDPSDVDSMFLRIPNGEVSINEKAEELIAQARDVESMIKMPGEWMAWW